MADVVRSVDLLRVVADEDRCVENASRCSQVCREYFQVSLGMLRTVA